MKNLVATGAAYSEAGRVREANEDRVLLVDRAGCGASLYAVADGLGGHAAGGVASDLATHVLRTEVPALIERRVPPPQALVRALRRANEEILEHGGVPERSGMATTCTALIVNRQEGVVAHVGDSRAYLIRGREVRQLTTDHSLAEELLRHGDLAPDDAVANAQRHVLTRALGLGTDTQIDVLSVPLRGGDVLVLTTDGLHGAVPPQEIAAIVRSTLDGEGACRTLVNLANARGGLDNASVVVVRVRPQWAARLTRAVAPVALALCLGAGAAFYHLEHSYFLGVRGDRVALMRGVPVRLLGMPLFAVVRATPVVVTQVAPAYRGTLLQGIRVRTPEDADTLLADLVRRP
ncbi:MAG TPA: protein phosphatase 2C domain-containing protein [bacterium]|nr:protein phosphatase 2C domain-containing protein [bacterium]